MQINTGLITGESYPNRDRTKTSCHEVGHSGGLSHSYSANDCMLSGHVSSGHITYNSHHHSHLNQN